MVRLDFTGLPDDMALQGLLPVQLALVALEWLQGVDLLRPFAERRNRGGRGFGGGERRGILVRRVMPLL